MLTEEEIAVIDARRRAVKYGARDSVETAKIVSILANNFVAGCAPRNQAYVAGLRAMLAYRTAKVALPPLPYVLGTIDADEYFIGQDHARAIAPVQQKGLLL